MKNEKEHPEKGYIKRHWLCDFCGPRYLDAFPDTGHVPGAQRMICKCEHCRRKKLCTMVGRGAKE